MRYLFFTLICILVLGSCQVHRQNTLRYTGSQLYTAQAEEPAVAQPALSTDSIRRAAIDSTAPASAQMDVYRPQNRVASPARVEKMYRKLKKAPVLQHAWIQNKLNRLEPGTATLQLHKKQAESAGMTLLTILLVIIAASTLIGFALASLYFLLLAVLALLLGMLLGKRDGAKWLGLLIALLGMLVILAALILARNGWPPTSGDWDGLITLAVGLIIGSVLMTIGFGIYLGALLWRALE